MTHPSPCLANFEKNRRKLFEMAGMNPDERYGPEPEWWKTHLWQGVVLAGWRATLLRKLKIDDRLLHHLLHARTDEEFDTAWESRQSRVKRRRRKANNEAISRALKKHHREKKKERGQKLWTFKREGERGPKKQRKKREKWEFDIKWGKEN